jgi:predicted dehydrogenase
MLNIGIIGAGYIAEAHAAGYGTLSPSRVKISLVMDTHIHRASSLARRFGANALTDLDELLASDVEAVSICTPTSTHADIAIKAMRAGKHVLCEKPIARSIAQAEKMLAVAEERGVKLMVGHVSRYEADHRKAKEVIDRGDLGTLRMGSQSITAAFPEWSAEGWFADPEQSGGPVLDLAIHSIDYLLWLFGSKPGRVFARGVKSKIHAHTYAIIIIRFEEGGIGCVEVSWAHPRQHGLKVRTELIGSSGRLYWDYDGIASMRMVRKGLGEQSLVMVGENSFSRQVADFVRCIEEDAAPPISGAEALSALEVALAAKESLEGGRAVALHRSNHEGYR